ncbi:blue copper protein-like [Oryza brachyantha]|uniref:blue copper protein-like n=1 Tax=Oryza brachyantha TaxID=4533 RepID=UPI001AD9B9F0|nr:blue copper protein-like [Oryza brachyantha]
MDRSCSSLALCCVLLLVHGAARRAEAAMYSVGNSAGWDISADFPSWLDGKSFYVGDTLVFQYSKYHTVSEVDAAGYRNCSTANAVLTSSDGNTTVPLTAPGDRYFVCGNELHCLGGMRLHVPVVETPTSAGAPGGGAAPGGAGALAPGAGGEAGVPTLDFGGSHRLMVGPAAATWLCVAAALFVW